MPSPFPGMDPYLEAPYRWPDLHVSLIAAIRDVLAPQVAPDYSVRIDRRTYTIELKHLPRLAVPDAVILPADTPVSAERGGVTTMAVSAARTVALPTYAEVREAFLEVRDTRTGEGRDLYERERRHVLLSLTNLVEIDLLRAGQPMEMQPSPPSDYRALVRRGWQGARAQLFAFGIRDPLPNLPVPLREGEPEAFLALGPIFADLYDRARYDLDSDYREPPPEPALSPEDAAWLEALLREKGLRGDGMGAAGQREAEGVRAPRAGEAPFAPLPLAAGGGTEERPA